MVRPGCWPPLLAQVQSRFACRTQTSPWRRRSVCPASWVTPPPPAVLPRLHHTHNCFRCSYNRFRCSYNCFCFRLAKKPAIYPEQLLPTSCCSFCPFGKLGPIWRALLPNSLFPKASPGPAPGKQALLCIP